MPALPLWFTRYLPHLLIVLAVLAGVWWLQHIGYERATRDRDAADAKLHAAIIADLRTFEKNSAERENKRGAELTGRLDRLNVMASAGQERIIKEMTHEERYTDPDLGIPAVVRDEINRALAASTCASNPDGSIRCAVRDGDSVAVD